MAKIEEKVALQRVKLFAREALILSSGRESRPSLATTAERFHDLYTKIDLERKILSRFSSAPYRDLKDIGNIQAWILVQASKMTFHQTKSEARSYGLSITVKDPTPPEEKAMLAQICLFLGEGRRSVPEDIVENVKRAQAALESAVEEFTEIADRANDLWTDAVSTFQNDIEEIKQSLIDANPGIDEDLEIPSLNDDEAFRDSTWEDEICEKAMDSTWAESVIKEIFHWQAFDGDEDEDKG